MLNTTYSHQCLSGINDYSIITDEFRGEILCSNCGSVIADKMMDSSHGNPVCTKDDYFKKTTTEGQSKMYFPDKGLYTKIAKRNQDVHGNTISTGMKHKFNRLRLWDSRSKRNSTERTIAIGFVYLQNIKEKLGLPDPVCEKAALIFRETVEQNLIKGRSIELAMATTVYVACRMTDTPRTLEDISNATNIPLHQISKTYRYLHKNMPIKSKPMDPKRLINRISDRIGLSEKTRRSAMRFLDEAKKQGISVGRRPAGLASGAIYLAAALNGENVSYEKISKHSKTSDVTIRKTFHLFRKNLGIPELERYQN